MRLGQARFMRVGVAATSVLLVVGLGALVATVSSGASPKQSKDVTVTFGDKGTTVNLLVGQTLRVVLDNTYWSMNPPKSNSAALLQRGGIKVHPRLAGCVAGEGCGTVIALFKAAAPGTARVAAARLSCGEALRCTGGNGRFYVTVHVK